MTQQTINVGTAPNDGTGDPERTAWTKANANFTELYGAGPYAPLASPTFTGDPQAPTPTVADNDTSIATTEFVKSAIAAAGTGQIFYLDTTDAADVATYKRMLLTPSPAAESSLAVVCTGTTSDFLIGSFITDSGVPGAINFPAGSAYRRLYGKVSGGTAKFRLQVYIRTSGGTETLVRDEFSNDFSDTVPTLQEWLATPASSGSLSVTDRIVAKVSARRVTGPTNVTVTLYGEGSAHASQIQTTVSPSASTPISATAPLSITAGNISIDLSTAPQGRLTLATATPVMTTTQSSKTTIYYTPYIGNKVPIYDGTNLVPTTFTELSVATNDTTKSPAAIGASKVNDWFIWSDAGTIRLGHGPDWTSDTVRSAGTALVRVNGIWLNNASITNGPAASRGTYVGTTRSNASSQLDWIYGAQGAPPTAGFFGVWNAYNRRLVSSLAGDTTNTWTYASTTVRSANAQNATRHSFVSGAEEDVFDAIYTCHIQATAGVSIGVCYDVTNAFSGTTGFVFSTGPSSSVVGWHATTVLGFHFFQAGEATAGSANFWGALANTALYKTGIKFNGWM